jgi:hypothetical protein
MVDPRNPAELWLMWAYIGVLLEEIRVVVQINVEFRIAHV